MGIDGTSTNRKERSYLLGVVNARVGMGGLSGGWERREEATWQVKAGLSANMTSDLSF